MLSHKAEALVKECQDRIQSIIIEHGNAQAVSKRFYRDRNKLAYTLHRARGYKTPAKLRTLLEILAKIDPPPLLEVYKDEINAMG